MDETGQLAPAVVAAMQDPETRHFIADRLGQADVTIRFGVIGTDGDAEVFMPSDNGTFQTDLEAPPAKGQTREPTAVTQPYGEWRRVRAVPRGDHPGQPVHATCRRRWPT